VPAHIMHASLFVSLCLNSCTYYCFHCGPWFYHALYIKFLVQLIPQFLCYTSCVAVSHY
jgi:hypothetical protein